MFSTSEGATWRSSGRRPWYLCPQPSSRLALQAAANGTNAPFKTSSLSIASASAATRRSVGLTATPENGPNAVACRWAMADSKARDSRRSKSSNRRQLLFRSDEDRRDGLSGAHGQRRTWCVRATARARAPVSAPARPRAPGRRGQRVLAVSGFLVAASCGPDWHHGSQI